MCGKAPAALTLCLTANSAANCNTKKYELQRKQSILTDPAPSADVGGRSGRVIGRLLIIFTSKLPATVLLRKRQVQQSHTVNP